MLVFQNQSPPDAHTARADRRDSVQDLMVIGAHGGAGTSTLADLLRPAWDLGAINHLAGSDRPPLRAEGRLLVVVARNTVAAAWHATNAVTALCGHTAPIAALVIIADGAGKEPRDATARFSLLESRVHGTVRMPFVPALRLVDHVRAIELPEKATAALTRIRDLADAHPGR